MISGCDTDLIYEDFTKFLIIDASHFKNTMGDFHGSFCPQPVYRKMLS